MSFWYHYQVIWHALSNDDIAPHSDKLTEIPSKDPSSQLLDPEGYPILNTDVNVCNQPRRTHTDCCRNRVLTHKRTVNDCMHSTFSINMFLEPNWQGQDTLRFKQWTLYKPTASLSAENMRYCLDGNPVKKKHLFTWETMPGSLSNGIW